MKSIRNKRKTGIVALVLPVMLLLVIYAIWGQYPFGEHTLLVWDMNWQYCSFFSYLHDMLHGDASAVYSFSRAYGGDMISVGAYYLMSPFNLLFYFFDAKHIYIGILVVTILKTGCIGLSMFLFLNRREQTSDMLVFSTAYALSSYVIAYQFNLMWMDALILLPLMIWGIELLVDRGKGLLYIIMVALAVITNFYMGYILCIFSVLYFLCYFILISEQKRQLKTVLSYGICSLTGGALSAWISIPTLYALQGGKSNFNFETIRSVMGNFGRTIDFRTLLNAGFMGTIRTEQISGGGPLLYCGVFSVLLGCYWFLCKEVKVRQKIAYMILLVVLLVSMLLCNLNYIWHAMTYPMGSPYRFSFLYIFLLVDLAAMGFRMLGDQRKEKYILAGIGIVLIAVLIFQKSTTEFVTRRGAFKINLALIFCYVVLLCVRQLKDRKWKYAVNITLCCLACGEIVLNAEYLYFNTNQYDTPTTKKYTAYVQNMEDLLDEVPKTTEFHRTVFDEGAQWANNDPFLFHVYGLDSYTSVEKINAQLIAKNFGYLNSITFGAHYTNGSTLAAETLLGVKYLVATEEPGAEYGLLAENDGYSLYENPNALSLAILADESILKINADERDPFTYLNQLYQSMTEAPKDVIFEEILPKQASMENLYQVEEGVWQRENESGEAYVDYEMKSDKSNRVYVFYGNTGISNVELKTNGNAMMLSEQGSVVKSLGEIKPEDEVVLRVWVGEGEQFHPDELYIYAEQGAILKKYAEEIQMQTVEISMESDSKIMISYENQNEDKKYLFFTIPYEEGWTVKLDGKKIDTTEAQNCLIVEAPCGKHEVELVFKPRGCVPGIVITVIAVCACAVMLKKETTGRKDAVEHTEGAE